MRLRSDLLPAVVVAALQLLIAKGAPHWQQDRLPPDLLGGALLLVGPLLLAVRRRAPVPAMAGSVAAAALYILLGYAYGPPFPSPIVMVFLAVGCGHRRAAWLSCGAFFAFVVVYTTWLAPVESPGWYHHLSVGAFILVVLTLSEIAKVRRDRAAERRRTAREEERRQASEERLTMAQELHDVLAHNISLIHVQASTALHLMNDHPEQARTALTTIKQASKDVLGEMRSVLNVLREGAPRSPTAGLDRLDELVARSGLEVTKRVDGDMGTLPPGVERAAYRIIQESLTNVTRHAPGAAVSLLLERRPGRLLIRVTDEGSQTPGALADAGGGNGVPGMRERAAALGGTLTAGPHGRGFTVEARLPVPEEDT
ncbi:histidine kinase [Microtetraspora sp. NBRC 13810]|uniref:sensor histidine kinase n=1 Tax=Microtetraspora sp. NBRC 13810 TaxID=3030990 RepID=UPI002555DD20|nr:histidine kinase [Microtetraspora sp. NBRC 13810]